jgi:hypothetical protein
MQSESGTKQGMRHILINQGMKRLFLAVLLGIAALTVPGSSAQTTLTITVTDTPVEIRATSTGYFGVLYENASPLSAAFTVIPSQSNGVQPPPVNVSVGAAYVFTRVQGQPFHPGDFLGSVASSTPGPYTFILVQYANPPNAPLASAVKCPSGQSVNQINPDGSTVCLPETPAGQSSIMQWNAALDAVTFTAPGTWSAPMWFTNSNPIAQQNQAGTEVLENTDGQFEMVTFSNGQVKSLLNLDTDGHIDLYGETGGGIATDQSGNTCLAGPNGSCWNVVFANNGPLVNYQGVPLTSGHGMPVILYGGGASFSGNFGPYTLYTAPATGYTALGLFRLSGYAVETSAVAGATLQVRVDYTDASGANSQDTGTPLSFSAVGTKLPFSFILQGTPSQPINITVNTANSPQYTIFATLEAL